MRYRAVLALIVAAMALGGCGRPVSRADITDLQKQMSQLQAQVKDLKAQVGDLQAANAQDQSEIDALDNAMVELMDQSQILP